MSYLLHFDYYAFFLFSIQESKRELIFRLFCLYPLFNVENLLSHLLASLISLTTANCSFWQGYINFMKLY